MAPNFKNGQYVITEKFSQLLFGFQIGDAVIIKSAGGRKIIKRITAQIGYNYFVEGDNRGHSTDSRHFGPIDKKDIFDKVFCL